MSDRALRDRVADLERQLGRCKKAGSAENTLALELEAKLDRCAELLATEAAECGKMKRQLAKANHTLAVHLGHDREIAENNQALTAQAARLREALETAKPIYERLKTLRPVGSGWRHCRTYSEERFVRAMDALALMREGE